MGDTLDPGMAITNAIYASVYGHEAKLYMNRQIWWCSAVADLKGVSILKAESKNVSTIYKEFSVFL